MDHSRFRILGHGSDEGLGRLEGVTAKAWRTFLVELGGLGHFRQCFGVDPCYQPNSFLRSLRESSNGRTSTAPESSSSLRRRASSIQARSTSASSVLQTVPGIASYRSLLIATEVAPIDRFPAPKHLVSYAGLAPKSSRSGVAPVRLGSVPAAANRWLRGALVRAVVAHYQHAPDSWLSRYYERQKARISWQIARVAAARKLARAIHAMLRTGEVWRAS